MDEGAGRTLSSMKTCVCSGLLVQWIRRGIADAGKTGHGKQAHNTYDIVVYQDVHVVVVNLIVDSAVIIFTAANSGWGA